MTQAHPVVLLAAHGTRDADGATEALAFAELLAGRLGRDTPLVPCFLELTDPPILDTVERLARDGVCELVVAPLMLFGAAHVKNVVPAAIAVARTRFPELTIRYGTPLGVQPELLAVVDERLRAVESAAAPFPRERTAVLPYFLFTGVLVRRISQVVAEYAASQPGVELLVAEHLGAHPRLLDLAARWIAETVQGSVSMTCDRCVYRVPLVGFTHRVGQPQTSDAAHSLREGGGAHDHHHSGHDRLHPRKLQLRTVT